MNVISPAALHFVRTCERCLGARQVASVILPPCPECGGAGFVSCLPDGQDLAYLARSENLPHLLARLPVVIGQSRQREQDYREHGYREHAVIEAARRSGMAEVASALDLWMTAQTVPMPRKGAAHAG